jgi:DNA invertase Pin-like site-specific DNA recombinase
VTGGSIPVHKSSPFCDHRFIEDLCVLQWCSVYSCFVNTAVYVRVSTDHQRTDSQEQELKRYCRQRGWNKLKFFTDRISGAKASRPELDQMMQDIGAGKVERLVVYKLDRLGRSLTHLALILDELNRLRVPLIASSQGIDTSDDNPAGRLQLGVLMAVAEFERGIIKERVNAGLAAAKARGVQLGRPATINGRAAEIRKLKAKGLGLRAIARQLEMPPFSVHKALSMAA